MELRCNNLTSLQNITLKDLKKVSTCLSDVMSDIGVTEEIVQLRRNVHLKRVAMTDVFYMLDNHPRRPYNFGSQSEGTFSSFPFLNVYNLYFCLINVQQLNNYNHSILKQHINMYIATHT